MAHIFADGQGQLCPNCKQQPADMPTPYDEALVSETRAVRPSRRRRQLSHQSVGVYGTATLCGACAAAYQRNVALRTNGRRLVTWGFWAVVASAILYYVLIGQIPALAHGPQAILPALPVLACMLVVGAGLLVWAAGMVGRRSATRFLPARP